MQLAGHLCVRALEEWNLIGHEDKTTCEATVSTLQLRLDPGN